jgi:DNA-directed RNA polymerase subunit RPC12/RpoP
MTTSAKDRQVGGTHYKGKAMQPWDVIEAFGLNYWTGNAIKYICRDKNDRIEDLKKAIHYLEYEVERLEKESTHDPIYCPECRSWLEDDDVFCPSCNHQVKPLPVPDHPTYYPL